MPTIINIRFLQGLLDQLKVTVMLALTRLGLLNPPEEAESEDPACGLVLRVPVIEYNNFLERYGVMHDEDVDTECSVCLNCVERSHEIRELSNCYHVFHKECLDRWVDEGQVTCPLCRTMIFPAKVRKDNLDL
ncbi:hypothetical protein ACB092_01G143400 [Castanea dentata]